MKQMPPLTLKDFISDYQHLIVRLGDQSDDESVREYAVKTHIDTHFSHIADECHKYVSDKKS